MDASHNLEEKLRMLVPISLLEKGSHGELYLRISKDNMQSSEINQAVLGLENQLDESEGFCYCIPKETLDNAGIHVSTSDDSFKRWLCEKVMQYELPEEKIRFIVIGNQFYAISDLKKDDIIRNMLDACNVVLALWDMADINTGEEIIFLTKKYTQINRDFRKEWIFNTHGKADRFISIARSESINDFSLKALLKSEICSEIDFFSVEERMMKFCEMFSTIMDNFSFCLSSYMDKNSSFEAKKRFNDMILDTDKKIRDALGGLKSELAVFLSMYFAMSGFRSGNSPSDMFVNSIITASLFVVAIIYSIVLIGDFLSLATIKKECEETVKEINEKNDKDNKTAKEMRKSILSKRNKAKFYQGVIIIICLASFAPPIMALFL